MPADLVKKVYDRIGCKFYNVYGSSEGPCTQTSQEDPPEIVLHSVGRPICPYDEFKVIDSLDKPPAPGQEGELVARGPCIFQGYYKSEAENREVFTADGFYRTGDLVRFDPEGRMIITGRKKDVIIRGGENISAKEVEELVAGHPRRGPGGRRRHAGSGPRRAGLRLHQTQTGSGHHLRRHHLLSESKKHLGALSAGAVEIVRR